MLAAGIRAKFARNDSLQLACFGLHRPSGGVLLAGWDARRRQSQVMYRTSRVSRSTASQELSNAFSRRCNNRLKQFAVVFLRLAWILGEVMFCRVELVHRQRQPAPKVLCAAHSFRSSRLCVCLNVFEGFVLVQPFGRANMSVPACSTAYLGLTSCLRCSSKTSPFTVRMLPFSWNHVFFYLHTTVAYATYTGQLSCNV